MDSHKLFAGLVAAVLISASAGGQEKPDRPAADVAPPPRVDLFGDPLPPGALARLGTVGGVRSGHAGGVGSAAWAPDGKALASGGEDQRVRLWDGAMGKEGRACAGHRGGANSVAYAPDGKTLASAGGDQTVRLWDVA